MEHSWWSSNSFRGIRFQGLGSATMAFFALASGGTIEFWGVPESSDPGPGI